VSRRISSGQIITLLTLARGKRHQAVPVLAKHLKTMRRRDVEDLATCLTAILLALDEEMILGAGVGVLESVGLQIAEWGWQDEPAMGQVRPPGTGMDP
jgi:hypothetical protein